MTCTPQLVVRFDAVTIKTAVTLVVPCCNEAEALPFLAERLAELREQLAFTYELFFVFVDDGSTDETEATLRRLFGEWPQCQIVTHVSNRGLAAAIRTGIERAQTEIVCSMDSDCTYDPGELQVLLPLLTEKVDLVTASPYHPAGKVVNIPAWRLLLSQIASRFYRLLLRNKLHTYTSCFRVYRRSAILKVLVSRQRFDGIAELLVRLDEQGSVIVEHPATLHVRQRGQSKLRLLATIRGHLSLLAELFARRLGFRKPRVALPTFVPQPDYSPKKEVPCLERIPA